MGEKHYSVARRVQECLQRYDDLKDIVDGEVDDLPELAFFMVGNIEEAKEKAKTL